MPRKYACYHDAIKKIINIGEQNKLTLADIIKHPEFGLKTEHIALAEFNKFIRREIRHLITKLGKSEHSGHNKLVELKSKAGREHYYFWASAEDKHEAIHGEGISQQRYFARAVVFSFIEENLREFFPPDIMASLKKDLNNAYNEFDLLNGIAGKMQFIPSGVEICPAFDLDERNPADWQLAYQALKDEFVIQADYKSLHSSSIERLHLSPQRVQYSNHKVVLLCYVHEAACVKAFEVSRLLKVAKVKGRKFKQVYFEDVEQRHQFEAIVNVGVKDYFHSVKFGEGLTSTHVKGDTWLVKATIKVPEHFSKDKAGPDPFALANFLAGFADAMIVLKPEFLSNEMKRRAEALAKLYADPKQSYAIISKSPHLQTGNAKKLTDIAKN
ncbi:WYL domain-containing protein [Colwellia chukchiensis]|uniref:WYL domain-containing protein n=1 Tax=Colwellia chukchiensis TaxID=641665 RepID=A0A1H7JNE1_9GAMM|nr:WYL domain-containing protein [Colwellia chukchiensis]SEK75397.1 WYL domain-containing protein [Colwellia chukchiensis]